MNICLENWNRLRIASSIKYIQVWRREKVTQGRSLGLSVLVSSRLVSSRLYFLLTRSRTSNLLDLQLRFSSILPWMVGRYGNARNSRGFCRKDNERISEIVNSDDISRNYIHM